MASEIQGLPEADRKVEDGIGVGLAGDSALGEVYQSAEVGASDLINRVPTHSSLARDTSRVCPRVQGSVGSRL